MCAASFFETLVPDFSIAQPTRLRRAGRLRTCGASFFDTAGLARDRRAECVTPALAAWIADHLWTMEEIIGLMDEAAPKPGEAEIL
jgi:hypothetical protein